MLKLFIHLCTCVLGKWIVWKYAPNAIRYLLLCWKVLTGKIILQWPSLPHHLLELLEVMLIYMTAFYGNDRRERRIFAGNH